LKKSGLDSSQKKNYRPVSNLSFLSKLLERAAKSRLEVFLDSNDLMPTMQSAYRRFHSTETSVLKVCNDLLLAADNGDVTALCLLDLTAAFDTGSRHGSSSVTDRCPSLQLGADTVTAQDDVRLLE